MEIHDCNILVALRIHIHILRHCMHMLNTPWFQDLLVEQVSVGLLLVLVICFFEHSNNITVQSVMDGDLKAKTSSYHFL